MSNQYIQYTWNFLTTFVNYFTTSSSTFMFFYDAQKLHNQGREGNEGYMSSVTS